MERARNSRFMPRFRLFLDELCGEAQRSLGSRIPLINREFFRQLFHYSIHKILSRFLRILAVVEGWVRVVVHFNRRKATERTPEASLPHLRQIAEHKEEVALSEKEKKSRKAAALRG